MNVGHLFAAMNQRRIAFTLVEVLVVIAVIGIIAALLIPALAVAKAKVSRIHCVSNLRQLGLGVHLYSDDHSDRLPGPLWQVTYENFNNWDNTRLGFYTATYSTGHPPALKARAMPTARCPAAVHLWKEPPPGSKPMDVDRPVSYNVVSNAMGLSRPFGYPYSFWPEPKDNPGALTHFEEPKRFREIAQPAAAWSFSDADQGNVPWWARCYPFLPETRAHGAVRNELFFDLHAGSTKD
jgi:prepilin-type N-terminal cleavage/methylation domain-containing protein